MLIGPGAVQDGLGIVLVRSFFRLAVRVRFFDPLGLLLGPSWGAPGPFVGRLGVSWVRFRVLRGPPCPLCFFPTAWTIAMANLLDDSLQTALCSSW